MVHPKINIFRLSEVDLLIKIVEIVSWLLKVSRKLTFQRLVRERVRVARHFIFVATDKLLVLCAVGLSQIHIRILLLKGRSWVGLSTSVHLVLELLSKHLALVLVQELIENHLIIVIERT